MKPVFLLDIDGVLNAATKKPDRSVWPVDAWIRGHAHDGRHRWPILGARPVADFIREVHEQGRAEIRWHTTWQDMAKYVGDLLKLPDFPVAEAPEWAVHLRAETEEWWKIGAALRVVEDERRPLVWTDDDLRGTFNLDQPTRDRIASAGPALLLGPNDTTGLTPKHLRMIDEFLTDVTR